MIGVIDASLALSWLFEDEQTVQGMRLLDQVAHSAALVPSLWRLETANALQTALKRRRCNSAFRDLALLRLGELAIEVDFETDAHAWTTTLHLSERHNITVYDAAYLELALRRGVPLATRDQDLAKAAVDSGVTVLPTS